MASASAPSGENTRSRLLIDLYPQAARLAAGRHGYLPELEPFAEATAARRRLFSDLHADLVAQDTRRDLDGGGRTLHERHLLRDHPRRRRGVMALAKLARIGE